MYAVVRINQLDRDRLRTAQDRLREFDRTHSAQPGYRGTLNVDLGSDRQLIVNLWDSEQHAAAGRAALSASVGRLLEPVLAQPSQLLGAGPVLALDLLPTPPDARSDTPRGPQAPDPAAPEACPGS